MSIATDTTYIRLLSHRLRNFKQKKETLWNFSCPICGDSQKNKSKARGYVFQKQQKFFYTCHNCGVGLTLGNFIKHIDSGLYKEYALEKFKEGNGIGATNLKSPAFDIPSPRFGKIEKAKIFERAEWIDKLPKNHFCLSYVKGRKIPTEFYDKLLYTDNFKAFCDATIPNHNKELAEDQRLIIPFYDEYNNLIGVAGRALVTADYKLRYIKIKANDEIKKLIYGLDRIDTTRTVKIVEGELDSIFLDNCIASGDSSLTQTAEILIEHGVLKENIILCPDREPRNREIVKIINTFIEKDYKVCLFPDTLSGKDINEHIINGFSTDQLEKMILENTYEGIRLRLEYIKWKKI